MVEMVYHLQFNGMLGPQMPFLGWTLHAKAPATWLGAGAVFLSGLGVFEIFRRRFTVSWEGIQEHAVQSWHCNGQKG